MPIYSIGGTWVSTLRWSADPPQPPSPGLLGKYFFYSGTTGWAYDDLSKTPVSSNLPINPDSYHLVQPEHGTAIILPYNGSYVARSVDCGVTWTKVDIKSAGRWQCCCYGNGRWVALKRDSSVGVYSNDDGITWSTTTLPASKRWNSVIWFNNKYFAFEYSALVSSNCILQSTDGINWTVVPKPANVFPYNYYFFGTNGNIICGVCSDSNNTEFPVWSTDGLAWSAGSGMSQRSSRNFFSYENNYFISPLSNNFIDFSLDGKSWTEVATPAMFTSVKWNGTIFIGLSGQNIYTSPDLINWTLSNITLKSNMQRLIVF